MTADWPTVERLMRDYVLCMDTAKVTPELAKHCTAVNVRGQMPHLVFNGGRLSPRQRRMSLSFYTFTTDDGREIPVCRVNPETGNELIVIASAEDVEAVLLRLEEGSQESSREQPADVETETAEAAKKRGRPKKGGEATTTDV